MASGELQELFLLRVSSALFCPRCCPSQIMKDSNVLLEKLFGKRFTSKKGEWRRDTSSKFSEIKGKRVAD